MGNLIFRGRSIWLLTSLFILAPIALAACSPRLIIQSNKNDSQGTTVSQTQAGDNTADVSSNVVPIGVWGAVRDDRAVQISSSKIDTSIFSTTYGFDAIAQKGGKIAVVFMTLKNTGSKSGDLDWSGFRLVDGQGREYDPLEDAEDIVVFSRWLKENGLGDSDDQLFPGATVQTAKGFRIAPDASNLMLKVNDLLFEIQRTTPEDSLPRTVVRQPEPSNRGTETTETQAILQATPQASTSSTNRPVTWTVQAKDGVANLRNRPSTEVGVVSKVPNGTAVEILDEQTNSSGQLWYQVKVNGQVGWLYSELLQKTSQQTTLRPGTYRMSGSNYIQIAVRGDRLCYRGSSNAGKTTASLSPISNQPGSYRIYNFGNGADVDPGMDVISQQRLNSYQLDNVSPNTLDKDLEACLDTTGNYYNQQEFLRDRR